MELPVQDKKTGKWYKVKLGGKDHRLVLRMHALLVLTGSLFTLTLMAFFAAATQGRPYSQEICIAFALGTLLAGKRAHTYYGEVQNMLDGLIAKHKSEHPHQ